jgi:hypothetical protein
MRRRVVDTNVPIVANGRLDRDGVRPSNGCQMAAVEFLQDLLKSGNVLIDSDGEIQAEYRKHLKPSGQPGVGDRFYHEVLNSAPRLIERIKLPKREDGEYADLPQPLIDVGFDHSDRKFAALARREQVPVANATDSDWLEHHATLVDNGIHVQFVCGCDKSKWFTISTAPSGRPRARGP